MKVFAILAALTIATVSAADCDVAALAPIATGPDATQCGADAEGYSVIAAKAPTATQLPKMCLSKACNNLLAALKTAAPSECMVTIAQPPVELYAKLLTPIETACEKIKKDAAAGGATTAPVSTSATPATTKPATTSAAPGVTSAAPTATTAAPANTTAPVATTAAPAEEETSSASGSGEEIESPTVTEAPAATKAAANATTPTPAPKSGASSVVAAAGAVVVAVAASLF